MTLYLWISVAANALLCIALVGAVRLYRSDKRLIVNRLLKEREEAERVVGQLKQLSSDYCTLAGSVSTSLESIRADIDRNYHHTHDGHVLDTIASRLRREVAGRTGAYEIPLYDYEIRQVEALGGQVSSRGAMTLGQMLEFAWNLHTLSRERGNQLTTVVQQPCGNQGHAVWLGKMLAIYELMCDRNKDLAVERLSAVIEAWRYEPAEFAPRYVEDTR
ncbi:hypothetical protein [Burkholderia vietnamiensis]|uniref:hypothetical protein n=1 Tax=Burkholderia vietnamiensis TaxID=60552 RepID=UPI0015939FAF|nr:hypothetical protein [Burkholderia vietnamiensis]